MSFQIPLSWLLVELVKSTTKERIETAHFGKTEPFKKNISIKILKGGQ